MSIKFLNKTAISCTCLQVLEKQRGGGGGQTIEVNGHIRIIFHIVFYLFFFINISMRIFMNIMKNFLAISSGRSLFQCVCILFSYPTSIYEKNSINPMGKFIIKIVNKK